MSNPLRKEVLQAFKNVHMARLAVFRGDERTLKVARQRINEEFRKNKEVSDKASIHDMILKANAVTNELRTTIVQAEEKRHGVFELRIRDEIKMLDNMPFNPDVEIPKRGRLKKGSSSAPCCQEDSMEVKNAK